MTPQRSESTAPHTSMADPSLDSILLRTRKKIFHLLYGEHESVFGGRGLDFREVRAYSSSDDIRHLNWKITARTGTPMVNLYNETKQIPVVLVYLNSGSLHFGTPQSKRTTAIELLTALSYMTVSHHDMLSTLLYSAQSQHWLPPSRHRGTVAHTFEAASALDPLGEACSFQTLNTLLLQKIKRKSLLFLVGDFWTFNAMDDLGELAHIHELYCLIVRDNDEEEIQWRGTYEITDPASWESHTLTVDRRSAEAYKKLAEAHDQRLTQHLDSHRIAHTKIYTHEDAIEKLAHFLRR